MIKLDFSNSFTHFVFNNVLSQQSKISLVEKLHSVIQLSENQDNKIFVKRKPQQVIVFVKYFRKNPVVTGYKFGQTDILTGTKKRHFKTVEQILREKTETEIEHLY
ncbi:hypothetical protein ACFFHT_02480 [Gallibacterium melopsittaci]|uniref:Uncharacterized protein n=1 Tax=Gallibacterium melopsittaci TaxID=516063 RepID=A0ABV6HUM3_9PAST